MRPRSGAWITMDFGAVELQLFVSVALILAALFAAVVVDLLKGNTESLQEENIALRVRQQERQQMDPVLRSIFAAALHESPAPPEDEASAGKTDSAEEKIETAKIISRILQAQEPPPRLRIVR